MFEDKFLIETYCNHRFCIECLIQLKPNKDSLENPCPFCKQNIEFIPIE
jgi:NADH pyrophosphatase NudC (nudix superfamily)